MAVHRHILEPLEFYKEYLSYDLESGIFTWLLRVSNKKKGLLQEVPIDMAIYRLD